MRRTAGTVAELHHPEQTLLLLLLPLPTLRRGAHSSSLPMPWLCLLQPASEQLRSTVLLSLPPLLLLSACRSLKPGSQRKSSCVACCLSMGFGCTKPWQQAGMRFSRWVQVQQAVAV